MPFYPRSQWGPPWQQFPTQTALALFVAIRGVPLADTGPVHTALSWENSPLTSAGLLMCQENARLGLLAGRDAPGLISADLPSGAKVWNVTWRNLSSKKLSVAVFPADIVASEILWCFRSHSWLRLGRAHSSITPRSLSLFALCSLHRAKSINSNRGIGSWPVYKSLGT